MTYARLKPPQVWGTCGKKPAKTLEFAAVKPRHQTVIAPRHTASLLTYITKRMLPVTYAIVSLCFHEDTNSRPGSLVSNCTQTFYLVAATVVYEHRTALAIGLKLALKACYRQLTKETRNAEKTIPVLADHVIYRYLYRY